MTSEKKKNMLFEVKREVEEITVDDQDDEILEQFRDEVDVILIRKPVNLPACNLRITPNENGSLNVEVASNSNEYAIECTSTSRLRKKSALFVRKKISTETKSHQIATSSSTDYVEVETANILGFCKITKAHKAVSDEISPYEPPDLIGRERERQFVLMKQRYEPYGCLDSTSDSTSIVKTKKKSKESKRKRKRESDDDDEREKKGKKKIKKETHY